MNNYTQTKQTRKKKSSHLSHRNATGAEQEPHGTTHDFLWGEVEDENARTIVEQLCYLSAVDPGKPIHLYINSPGGMVTAGNAIHDMMQRIPSPVYTYCIGHAASMAAILLSAEKKQSLHLSLR